MILNVRVRNFMNKKHYLFLALIFFTQSNKVGANEDQRIKETKFLINAGSLFALISFQATLVGINNYNPQKDYDFSPMLLALGGVTGYAAGLCFKKAHDTYNNTTE